MSDSLANAATRVRRYTTGERQKDDFYATPHACTEALLAVERFPLKVWEPACGDGAISVVLERHGHDVVSTDLVNRGFGTARRDFLFETRLAAPAVVTNPPFKLGDDFARHALALGVEKMAIFHRLAWLEGRARYDALWSKHPPIRIWQFCGRHTLWRGDDADKKDKGGTIAFAWFVWERGYQGAPAIGWLR